MATENADVKTEVDSSTTSTATSETVATDAQGDSSTQVSTEKAQTLQDVVKAAFDASQPQSEQADKGNEPEVTKDANEEVKEGEGEDNQQQETEGEEKDKQQTETEKGPIPYERFVEVNTAKKDLEQQVETVRPLVEAQQQIIDHCLKYNITEADFQHWMNVAALSKSDPAQAYELLKPTIEQMQSFRGDLLPKDIQEMVDNGEMSLAAAKRLVAAENRMQFTQKQQENAAKQAQQQTQQRYVQEMHSALNSYVTQQRKSDPDFKPKEKGQPDGKYELFLYKFASEAKSATIQTPEQLVQFANQVLGDVNAVFQRLQPNNGKRAVVKTTDSGAAKVEAPKTLRDAIRLTASRHGINS